MCIGSERCAWRWGAGCTPFFFVCVWGLLCWHRKPSNKWHHMEASLWWDMARISFGSIRQWQNPHRLSWYVFDSFTHTHPHTVQKTWEISKTLYDYSIYVCVYVTIIIMFKHRLKNMFSSSRRNAKYVQMNCVYILSGSSNESNYLSWH